MGMATLISTGRAEPREREWDALAFEDLSGKPALINPIKLKAMAMKMRHRLHNLEFKRPTSVPESLCVAGVESEPQPARAPKTPVQLVSGQTYSVMYIVGTDNFAGLKTIFNHPLSILLLACPLGVLPARLTDSRPAPNQQHSAFSYQHVMLQAAA
eukprot:s349_g9.t1